MGFLRTGTARPGAGGTAYTLNLSETVSTTEAIARADSKPFAETASLSESLVRALSRTLTDAAGTSDTISVIRLLLRTLSETATLSEARLFATATTKAETVTLTDTLTRVATLLRTLSESASLSDARSYSLSRTLADGVTLTDTVAASKVVQKLLSEAVGLSDALSRAVQLVRGDTVTLTEARTLATSRMIAESATLTDSATRAMSRALSEAVTLADTVTSLKLFLRILTENLTLTDTRTDAIGKQLAETATLTEAFTRLATFGRALSEALTLTDTRQLQDRKTFGEAVSLTELRAFTAGKILSEAATLTDLTRKLELGRALVEAVTLADGLSRDVARTLADVLALVDDVLASTLSNAFGRVIDATTVSLVPVHTSASLIPELQTARAPLGVAALPVEWGAVVGCSVAGGILTKTIGYGWGNAGAASLQTLNGPGYVEWVLTAGDTPAFVMAGLSNGNSTQDYPDVDYCVYCYWDGGAARPILYYRNGTYLDGNYGVQWAAGDVFRLEADAGQVRFLRNGSLYYTFAYAPTFPLLFDCSLYAPASQLGPVLMQQAVGVADQDVESLIAAHEAVPLTVPTYTELSP